MSTPLRNIALIGASGNAGSSILDALLQQGKQSILILSRLPSRAKLPNHPQVSVIKGDYDDETFLQEALKGQDALIITLGMAGLKHQPGIFEAAAKAGVKYVIPSQFGQDSSNPKILEAVPMLQGWPRAQAHIQELGMKCIAVVNGLWLDYILQNNLAGFDVVGRKATIYEDGGSFCMTTLGQVGRGVAAMLALPESVLDNDFANKGLYISSFRLTHAEFFTAILKATETTKSEWVISRRSVNDLWAQAAEKLEAGNMSAAFDQIYGATFTPGFGGDFSEKLHNGMLQLPSEDLEEAIRMALKTS